MQYVFYKLSSNLSKLAVVSGMHRMLGVGGGGTFPESQFTEYGGGGASPFVHTSDSSVAKAKLEYPEIRGSHLLICWMQMNPVLNNTLFNLTYLHVFVGLKLAIINVSLTELLLSSKAHVCL